MVTKYIIFMTVVLFACVNGGILPGAFVAPYASTYNAHFINHAIHTPIVTGAPGPFLAPAPVAAAAPFVASAPVAATAPFVAPAPLVSQAPAQPAIYNANIAPYSTIPAAYRSFPGIL